jgi:hypothetical protein
MTTTRINHTGHAHANTTAARTACRKAAAKFVAATTPMILAAKVGAGKAIHAAERGTYGDGTIGTRCGTGAMTTVKGIGDVELDSITCKACINKHGQAHG